MSPLTVRHIGIGSKIISHLVEKVGNFGEDG